MTCQQCGGRLAAAPTTSVDGVEVHAGCKDGYLRSVFPFPCPACFSKGTITTKTHEERTCCVTGCALSSSPIGSFAGCEWCDKQVVTTVVDEWKECELCDGRGRLKHAPIAQTEQVIKGWTRGVPQ